MANTYTQLNIHCVFAVKGRHHILDAQLQIRLHKYINGIIKSYGSYPLAVGGYKDHVHCFFEIDLQISVSKAMQIIKANSSKWINDNGFLKRKFSWQSGYGAFSYSKSQRNDVIQYIMNQEKHHKKRTFKEEYIELLKNYGVEYKNEYLFEFY